ncbi:MAG: HD-GYP domain-containing protein [Myxococcota bacterium]
MDELDEAVERLARTVEQLRAGDDEGFAGRVAERGEQLVRTLHGLLRLNRTHAANNQAFERPVLDMRDLVAGLLDELGTVQVSIVEDEPWINDVRIKLGPGEVGRDLARELARHGVGGISFHVTPLPQHVRTLMECFAAQPAEEHPVEALARRLRMRGVAGIELWGMFRFKLSDEADVQRHERRDVGERAGALIDETWTAMGEGRAPDLLRIRRAVGEMVSTQANALLVEEAPGATPYATHTVRVCQLALLLGRAAGLDAEALQELGVAAMVHDVGYAAREGGKPADDQGPAVEGFAPPFARHPAAAARLLLRQRGFHPGKVRRVLAVLQHHRDYTHAGGQPSLFARILRVAEDFDNLVRSKGGNCTPSDALARMAARTGVRYDPVLFQLFANAMGQYPPGTLLELADGRVIRVRSPARSPETWDKPVCAVVKGGTEPAGTLVDLAAGGTVAGVMAPTA